MEIIVKRGIFPRFILPKLKMNFRFVDISFSFVNNNGKMDCKMSNKEYKMFQVCVQMHFDAAHFIRNYDGKCANLHGHRWNVVVCIEGRELDDLGMLIDFSEVKKAMRKSLTLLDHSLLNDLPSFGPQGVNPTAEHLAQFMFRELQNDLVLGDKRLAWVKIYESPDTWTIFKED
ncbi:6-carboxytetrahydropterin synthase QueD [Desulfosporosinus metallidurans]|uniref:6-carboxy-5,6,7,8-tetrahydropterin synthase n=1 Tax=Desulfosporosinus metallidurans TaxID=1888891 RepID=A0A1Q8QRK7_9FIRM|nr:6-carboxytetrahydropterin synthase QueD [Desulfosporosinus metallidurans]OLN29975.1 6-carboxytetrahydropterin synthase [Desulfosporosinus metallidurans]